MTQPHKVLGLGEYQWARPPDSPLDKLPKPAFQASPMLLDVKYETLPVRPLSPDDIVQVIERPAETAGFELESGLTNVLVNDTETHDPLPLLAFTLRELWGNYGADRRLDISEYRELGGLEGSVAKVADEVVSASDLDRRAFAVRWLAKRGHRDLHDAPVRME